MTPPDSAKSQPTGRHGQATLTPKQIEVVRLAASGMTAKEIAHQLGLSRRSIEDRLTSAKRRAGKQTLAALIAWSAQAGII